MSDLPIGNYIQQIYFNTNNCTIDIQLSWDQPMSDLPIGNYIQQIYFNTNNCTIDIQLSWDQPMSNLPIDVYIQQNYYHIIVPSSFPGINQCQIYL